MKIVIKQNVNITWPVITSGIRFGTWGGEKMDKETPIDLKKAWEEHLKRMEKKKKNGETEKHTDEAGAKRPWENLLRVSMVL